MNKISCLLLTTAVFVPTFIHAADLSGDPSGMWKSLPAIYKIHSGIVADRTPPTSTDRMLTVHVDGKGAHEIFNSIGPDAQPTCSGEKGDRNRRRKGIYCSYTVLDAKAKGGPYRCWIGVDLRTGNSEITIGC